MPSTERYSASSFYLTATIGGRVFDDVLAFNCNYALNTIPTASLIVATGREIHSRNAAKIHQYRDSLRSGDEAIVKLWITNTGGRSDMMEEGEYIVFRGKYAGIGYQRGHDSANYSLQLVHWLDDLNQGSIINGYWFPGAPYDMAQSAAVATLGGSGDAYGVIPTIDADAKIVVAQNITGATGDFWNKVLKEIFLFFTKLRSPRYQTDGPNTLSPEEQNKAAIAALNAIGRISDGYEPLRLQTKSADNKEAIDAAFLRSSILAALIKDGASAFAYTTFWNKLVAEYAAQFFFAISPSAEFALPIPFFAGLKTPYKTITADEYNYANFNASTLQQLESVDIFYGAGMDTGLQPTSPGASPLDPPSFAEPLGFFPPAKTNRFRGFKLLKEPPTWLTLFKDGIAGISAGVVGTPVNDGASAATPPPPPATPATSPGLLSNKQALPLLKKSGIVTNFAEHWYKTEVLSQRYGELSGKLRFDIAPGSIIAIETPTINVDRGLDPRDVLHATVTQVSCAINAQQGVAGTGFTLAHIRTEAENADVLLTSDKPPLYEAGWAGGPIARKVVP